MRSSSECRTLCSLCLFQGIELDFQGEIFVFFLVTHKLLEDLDGHLGDRQATVPRHLREESLRCPREGGGRCDFHDFILLESVGLPD